MDRATRLSRFMEVYDIIQGIKRGELDHKQDAYHCGTAHCIAGWLQFRHWERVNHPISQLLRANSGLWDYFVEVQVDTNYRKESYTLDWADNYLAINTLESISLFHVNLHIDEIEENFQALAKKYRLWSAVKREVANRATQQQLNTPKSVTKVRQAVSN